MNIIILAGGQGLRLGSISEDIPKFLVEYQGVPIFQRLLAQINETIKHYGDYPKITVVVGAKGRCWNQDAYDLYKRIKDIFPQFKINTVHNFDNDVTQNSFSLKLAFESLNKIEDTLIIDGDVVFNRAEFLRNLYYRKSDYIVVKKDFGMPSVKFNSKRMMRDISRDYNTGYRCAGIIRLTTNTAYKLSEILQEQEFRFKEVLDPLNRLFKQIKDIKALINNDTININTMQDLFGGNDKKCFLNDIYYKRTDQSVQLRILLGRELARQDKNIFDYDCVIPVMESGLHFASGFSLEARVPMFFGIERIAGVGRTLHKNNREILFDKKYIIYPEIFNKRKVVLVDEAIFSGKTLNYLVDKIKAVADPQEIHIRIITPPIMRDCKALPNDVIKCHDEITSKVDSIRFIEVDIFNKAMKDYCKDCLKGE